jgi:hypothetical protein
VPSITLRNDRWPVGTSVSAYARSSVTGGPTGSALETHAVAADGTLTFTTLSEGQQYVATDGVRSASFLVKTPSSGGSGGSLTIGTVTTLSPGASATAQITGDVLDLGIPRGDTGATGAAGGGGSIAATWTSLVPYLANGWRDYTVTTPGDEPYFYGPEYAKIGDLVFWRGVVDGGAASGAAIFTGLPAAIVPPRIATFIVSGATGLKDYNLWPDGHFQIVSGGAVAYTRIDGCYALGAGT